MEFWCFHFPHFGHFLNGLDFFPSAESPEVSTPKILIFSQTHSENNSTYASLTKPKLFFTRSPPPPPRTHHQHVATLGGISSPTPTAVRGGGWHHPLRDVGEREEEEKSSSRGTRNPHGDRSFPKLTSRTNKLKPKQQNMEGSAPWCLGRGSKGGKVQGSTRGGEHNGGPYEACSGRPSRPRT